MKMEFLSCSVTQMDAAGTTPYPGFDRSGQYYTPRKAARIRPEGSEFAHKNAGSINLFNDDKNTHIIGPPPSPRCISYEARQNYEKNRRGQVSGLLGGGGGGGGRGGLMPECESAPVARVKPEAQPIAEYHRGGNMSQVISHDSQRPLSARQAARVKVEASDNADLDKGQRMSVLLHQPSDLPSTPKPLPRVRAEAGDTAELGSGTQMATIMYEYGSTSHTSRPAPRVKSEASDNAMLDQGGRMHTLFASYGHQPHSARPAPRVRDGQDIAGLDQGGRLARLMHEGDHLPGDCKPPPRVTSSAARRITQKGKGSRITQVLSESSKWQIVPTPGVRKARA